jgi:mannose-6-phosphate isomerase-like protein (cupin superfamily)
MKILLSVFAFSVVLAQSPMPSNDFVYWPAAKLKGFPATLKAKAATGKKGAIAMEQLDNHGNFTSMVARRDAPGEPEVHADWNDIFIAQDGEATLLYGGKVEGGHDTTPGEGRGGKIVGGKSQKLGAGDMVIIPAGMPHQTNATSDKTFTYMVIKVQKK